MRVRLLYSLFLASLLSWGTLASSPVSARGPSCTADRLHAIVSHDEEMRRAAHAAGLTYGMPPGPISREVTKWHHISDATGKRRKVPVFAYFDSDRRRIRDPAMISRIEALGIPPAYEDVLISPSTDSHLQAVGYDSMGRKQYRYHPRWESARAEAKFARTVEFGRARGIVRKAVEKDLFSPDPEQRRLAAMLRVLDEHPIRIGSEEYAAENATYGLSTLLDEHVEIRGNQAVLRFMGKHGKPHEVIIDDIEIVAILRESRSLPPVARPSGRGERIAFRYRNSAGTIREIDAARVNSYLREVSGGDFTAKDFRTWAGTTTAARALMDAGLPANATQAKAAIRSAISTVAKRLVNTPAVSRASYIHPRVMEAYEQREPFKRALETVVRRAPSAAERGLSQEERLVLQLLAQPRP